MWRLGWFQVSRYVLWRGKRRACSAAKRGVRNALGNIVLATILVLSNSVHAAEKPIDPLEYMLQSDDTHNSWTLGGWDVRPDHDPEGSGAQTFILNKFSDAKTFEIYKITDSQIQLRFEVMRSGDLNPDGHWIRRFEEIDDADTPAPGAIWLKRPMLPGGAGFLSRFRQDKFIFDPATHDYIFDPRGSADELQTYISIDWATIDWGSNNHTGFDLNHVLRMTSQWQTEGRIFETYDYVRDKGPVNWRWCERVSTLTPMEGDTSGKIFHCEEGFVQIITPGNATHPPIVRQYDPKTHSPGRTLEVNRFVSHWRPNLGPQWYVVYRDLSKEHPLEKRNEQIPHDFSLPEWQSPSNATIADLPYVKTHRPIK